MLDRVIISHLDEMDKVSDEAEGLIEKVIKSLDIDEVLDDPMGTMQEVSEVVKEILLYNIIPKAIKNGEDFVSAIESLKRGEKIEIPDSSNPNLNKELVDDRSKS